MKLTLPRNTGITLDTPGTIDTNVYQRTVDYPDVWANGRHVMLDSEVLVTVRRDQVGGLR